MSEPVVVEHSGGSYPVYVEPGILGQLDQRARELLGDHRLAMIADAAVHQLYQAGRLGAVTWSGTTLTVPSGERFKTRETWAYLTDELLNRRFGRDSALIGLGGGVIGDLTGFVAATYMRGLPYLLVPTTLLAMLDASVGGKTGVNAPQGKNLIGAFHAPAGVIADPLALRTLSERDYRTGLAEAVKHGLVADAEYFEWMETNVASLLGRDAAAVARLVRRSVEIKADVVSQDERESGRRAILNAGHTVAHALEQAAEYRLSHGEAVAVGLTVECEIAEHAGVARPGLRKRVAGLLSQFGLPVRLPRALAPTTLLDAMQLDKKNRQGRIHYALVREIGSAHRADSWTTVVSATQVEAALKAVGEADADPQGCA
jgi:3-dehydroquinate synthase